MIPSGRRINNNTFEKEKKEQVPLFFPLRPSGPAAGTSRLLTSKVLLFIMASAARDYILPAVPSGAAQPD